jgi:hypothetical protein
MTRPNKVGVAALTISAFVAFLVLMNTSNGRMAQEGLIVQLLATGMFIYAGVRGARWWFAAPLAVILFWVIAAHIGALWN